MSYIGTQPVPQSLQSRQQFTGDGSTTTFATIGGVELYEDVFLNGVRLSRVDNEYSFDGTTLTITPAPANGDTVSIILRNDHSELIALPITDSAGSNVLSESGSVVTLTADEANVGSNALVVDASGNVGIGTSSPGSTFPLTVYGLNAGLAFQSSTSTSGLSQNSNHLYLDITRSGTAGDLIVRNGVGLTERMRIDSSGNIGAPSGTNIYNASDQRLKQNITDLSGCLQKVLLMRGVSFNWINDFCDSEADKTLYGLIAQELQIIDSNLVDSFSDNTITAGNATVENPLRVNEKFIIPMLVESIKEQQAIIESQQSQIDALTARIAALETT